VAKDADHVAIIGTQATDDLRIPQPEAHRMAKPHQSGPEQRVRMERCELVEALVRNARVRPLRLLITTPHNG
jgi:hypothetical protein